jgi:type IV pilus assembly protein PilV
MSMKLSCPPCKADQGGATLIEVLVTLVVVSLGILGFSALLITGLTSNKLAMDRSHASILAYSIIDSMRSNKANAVLETYDRALGDPPPSGTQTANTDVSRWLAEVQARFPSGDGSIDLTQNTNEVTVTIAWDENKSGSATSKFSVRSRL